MATALEYGLVSALVGVVIIAVVTTVVPSTKATSEPSAASTPAPLSYDREDSPLLLMTSGGPVVVCQEDFTFVPHAGPLGAQKMYSCERSTERQ